MHHLRGNAIPAGPLSDYNDILCYCGIPRSVLVTRISTLWVCRLKWLKIAKNSNFGGKFTPKGALPLSDFTKFCMGEGVTGLHPSAKFNPFGFKNMGLEPPKSQKLVIFGIYLAKRGIPLKQFLPNFAWGGSYRSAP